MVAEWEEKYPNSVAIHYHGRVCGNSISVFQHCWEVWWHDRRAEPSICQWQGAARSGPEELLLCWPLKRHPIRSLFTLKETFYQKPWPLVSRRDALLIPLLRICTSHTVYRAPETNKGQEHGCLWAPTHFHPWQPDVYKCHQGYPHDNLHATSTADKTGWRVGVPRGLERLGTVSQ